ncbi:glycosyltransferase family 1 protein [Variovorax sp. dw_954]|uniref:glycosyltransferase family 4 protein n=1 Tax=Variovorax sp. dw_954 TaxID=2720078 RepID=UPI001BD446E5|nr:glycosyltransferase family 1 protein [Variovorax sp. dw_954]
MTASPPRPRVGVDFHTFDGIFQGSRSHILGVYQEAIVQAPEIDFVFLLGNTARLRAEYPVFNAPNVELIEVPHAGGMARLGWQLALLQRKHNIDLLHMQYRLPFLRLGPCACTIHDTLFETHPQYFTPNFVRMSRVTSMIAMRHASLLFTVSEFSRGEIARLYDIDPVRIAITTNGIDTTRFHPGAEGADYVRSAGLEPGGYLCTVGRLEPRKNHLNLLRAYALLPGPRMPLVIIGQRDFHSEPIFDAVRTLGLEQDVRFMEKVPDHGLPALLRHAAVFVYPTFAEGFGMPVAEAMASGVPVVTSSTTSLPEVAGDAALTADPNFPTAIAAAVSTLLSNPIARSRAIERGIAQAARFNWRASAQVMVAAYRQHFAKDLP